MRDLIEREKRELRCEISFFIFVGAEWKRKEWKGNGSSDPTISSILSSPGFYKRENSGTRNACVGMCVAFGFFPRSSTFTAVAVEQVAAAVASSETRGLRIREGCAVHYSSLVTGRFTSPAAALHGWSFSLLFSEKYIYKYK